ncbi:MAG: PAS domain-containing protein, partial [Deltaproteobacteria bacterium]|nr:PAS domain-containing protein [Deltaproteobacteria bacterium]
MDKDLSEYWKTVVDIMHDGLLVMSPQGVIVSANKAAERLTGYKRGELLGKTCEILNCDGCKIFKNGKTWCGLFSHGKMRSKRCTITSKSGEPIHIIKRGCLLKDQAGQVIGAVETLADISEIVQKDDQIARMRSILRRKEGYYGILGRSKAMD